MEIVYAAVKALIHNNGKFLVIEQKVQNTTYIDLPWWRVEYGESPYDTLKREIKEEVSLDVDNIKPLGMRRFFRRDEAQVICNTFLCTSNTRNIDTSNNPVADENIVNHHRLSKEELLKLTNLPHESLSEIFVLL